MISAARWRFTVVAGLILAIGWAAMLALAAMNRRHEAALDPYSTKRLRLNDQSLFVEIPATTELQAKGLGGRDTLGDDRGMMWVYPSAQDVTFWMKDMRFGLDFLWIRDGQVIGVTANVPPPKSRTEQLQLIRSPEAVDRVVEVNAGYAATHGITIGTTVTEFDF